MPAVHDAEVNAMARETANRARAGGELSFFGMFATFDTPFEVTTSELAIELLFPADRSTAEAVSTLARERRTS